MENMIELENVENDTARILEDITLHQDRFGFWIEGIFLVKINQNNSRPFYYNYWSFICFSQSHSVSASSAIFFVSLRFQ